MVDLTDHCSLQVSSLQQDHMTQVDALKAQFARHHSQSEVAGLQSRLSALQVSNITISAAHGSKYESGQFFFTHSRLTKWLRIHYASCVQVCMYTMYFRYLYSAQFSSNPNSFTASLLSFFSITLNIKPINVCLCEERARE